jgi:hypothetical protein
MASTEHLTQDERVVRVVFASSEPLSLEGLRSVLARHTGEIARLEEQHAASTTIRSGDEAVVELAFEIDEADREGPACELETLAAVHDLELELAAEGFSLRSLRRAA